jgi:hypothetical protein
MEIKTYSFDIFFGNVNGIKIDNSYDLYVLNEYKKLNSVEKFDYIFSQDNDLSYLVHFRNIKFISIPSEAESLDTLYELKDLEGIQLYSNCLNKLDFEKLKNIKCLAITEDEKINDFSKISKIEKLSLSMFSFDSLANISNLDVKDLTLDFCSKLKSLKGIEKLQKLTNLTIGYCLKISDISSLSFIKDSLKELSISDCNKIKYWDVLEKLDNLERIKLFSVFTFKKQSLSNLNFIKNMPKLKSFTTDYKPKKNEKELLKGIADVCILD